MTKNKNQVMNEKVEEFRSAIRSFNQTVILNEINDLDNLDELAKIIAKDSETCEELIQLCESYVESELKGSLAQDILSPYIALIAPTFGAYIGAAFGMSIDVSNEFERVLVTSFVTIVLLSIFLGISEKMRNKERKLEFYLRLLIKKLKASQDQHK